MKFYRYEAQALSSQEALKEINFVQPTEVQEN